MEKRYSQGLIPFQELNVVKKKRFDYDYIEGVFDLSIYKKNGPLYATLEKRNRELVRDFYIKQKALKRAKH